jgi:malonyl-CoA/methylmalonyl-CoA synthetase
MNLAQELSRTFLQYGNKPAILFEGRPYSFRQIDEEIRKRALWLRRAGVERQDRIAILLPKSMEFVFWHLAVLAADAVSLPLNPSYPGEQISFFLRDSQSFLLVTDAACLENLRGSRAGEKRMKTLLIDEASPDGWQPLIKELARVGPGDCRRFDARDDDVAIICYTSGTTGNPKGAMITHRNLVSNMKTLQRIWQWTAEDILLHVLPLFHIHGLIVALHGALHAGSTTVMHEKFDAAKAGWAIEKDKCTLLTAVPTIYHRLLQEWKTGKPDLGSMRLFLSGASPLGEDLFHRFEDVSGFRILDRYGMTETGIIASNSLNPQGRIPKSVGYPLPRVEVRIAAERGGEAEKGEVGEVWVRGENVFKGYWQNEEKTEEVLENGWFKTGDLGRLDPQDFRLFLVGRSKELIISGGYKIFPGEVESVLCRHPAVREAAVIGRPDEDFGERVAAFVALRKGHPATPPGEIISFCKKHLVSYKCPKEIAFLDQLPRNCLGKVEKKTLPRAGVCSDGKRKKLPVGRESIAPRG